MSFLCAGNRGLIARGRKDCRRPEIHGQQLGEAGEGNQRLGVEMALWVKR